VHVCERCGLFAVANLKKNQFHCPACKSTTGIVQARSPGPWQHPLGWLAG
jgi:DNA-directed RNA polymerase II subunit RPB2